jgi:serine/threonine protein kinase
MLSSGSYDAPVDVWAAGCILAEMQLSHPLFKGQNEVDQLRMIVKFLGNPCEEDLQEIARPRRRNFIQVCEWLNRMKMAPDLTWHVAEPSHICCHFLF